jgi:hypothetical protein
MNKTKINYWVDVVIAIAFILSAISGLVFLLPLTTTTVLGISFAVWDQLHIWGSLAMISGVLVHLALHWKWVVTMTRKSFAGSGQAAKGQARAREKREPVGQPATAVTPTGKQLNRREFLQYAGIGALVAGAGAISYKTFFDSASQTADSVAASAASTPTATTATATSIPLTVQNSTTTGAVACRKGKVYDAYPGSCHDYVDADGDGYCDYSIPA